MPADYFSIEIGCGHLYHYQCIKMKLSDDNILTAPCVVPNCNYIMKIADIEKILGYDGYIKYEKARKLLALLKSLQFIE